MPYLRHVRNQHGVQLMGHRDEPAERAADAEIAGLIQQFAGGTDDHHALRRSVAVLLREVARLRDRIASLERSVDALGLLRERGCES